jgi:serine phosphatase RsbU (regulator of sigma subunit)
MSVDEPTLRISSEVRPTSSGLRPCASVVAGASCGKLKEIADRPVLVGRSDEAGLRLPDAGVSSRHCRLFRIAGFVFVEDLASTNGVFIDDERVEGTAPVPVGATLRLGQALVRLEMRDPAEVRKEHGVADDLAQAAAYVRALIPPPLASGPLRISWSFAPSLQLGGDAFGYDETGGGRFSIYLLDCCGHGARAALHAVSVMNVLRSRSLPGVSFGSPAAVLGALNEVFAMEQHGDMYFSAWYGTYDAATRRLSWACGGHPPPLLLRKDGAHESLAARGIGIGLAPFPRFEERSTVLAPGDRVLLYSDGAYEIRLRDGSSWTRGGFESLAHARALSGDLRPDALEREIRGMAADGFDDDVSLLLAEAAP